LERDLRNPKIVIAQLQLLLQLLTAVADGELAELKAEALAAAGGAAKKPAAKVAAKSGKGSDSDESDDDEDDKPAAKKLPTTTSSSEGKSNETTTNSAGVPATPKVIATAHAAATTAGGTSTTGPQPTNPYRRWPGFTTVANAPPPSMGAFHYQLPNISASAARRILQLMDEEKEHRKLLPVRTYIFIFFISQSSAKLSHN
jgi:hypothetical protein